MGLILWQDMRTEKGLKPGHKLRTHTHTHILKTVPVDGLRGEGEGEGGCGMGMGLGLAGTCTNGKHRKHR